jgi:hypothetical protein
MKRSFSAACVLSTLLCVSTAFAATFVVPNDREMVRRADAIVVASVLGSYTQLTPAGGIETVTALSVEEVLKGGPLGAQVTLYEPGGTYGDHATIIPGEPRFTDGQRIIAFLSRTRRGTFVVSELVLGKFTFVTDTAGRRLAVRDEGEIVGWDPDLTPHREPQRSADLFLDFVRSEVRGERPAENYYVPRLPLVVATGAVPRTKVANAFTGNSYTIPCIGSQGCRWPGFPAAVTFYNENTEPGAQGGGVTAIQAALGAWSSNGTSNINYAYGGSDSGHTNGLGPLGPDGRNTVQFERDLTAHGVAPFTCSGSSYSGVLGIGGITNASGSPHTFNGETFYATTEGDVEMNQGIANCTLLLTTNVGDWNSALTHEIGHTLGFRHADQTRDGSAACATDPSLECASVAIMRSAVPHGLNATLQPWDRNAATAVYGACVAPGISSQPQATPPTIASGSSSQLSVTATGTAPSYQWYIGNPGNTSSPTGSNSSSISVSPTTTTTYWVRITGNCGAPVDSAAVTVTVNACTPVSISQQPSATPPSISSGGSSQLNVTAAGTGPFTYQWYIGNPSNTSSPTGTNSSSIMVSPTTTTTYWVRISNCGTPVDSNAVTVTVSTTCVPPSFTQDAVASPGTITAGNNSQLSVIVAGTSPSYQWYVGSPVNTGSPVGGGVTPSINVSPSSTTTYWVQVMNGCGSQNSRAVTVTVNPGGCAAPHVVAQPNDQDVQPGPVTLFVGYSGTASIVNWYRGIAPDKSNFVGQGQSLQLTVTQTTQFWAQVSNSCGTDNSQTATIHVTATCIAPNVSSAAANPPTIAPAGSSMLTVNATGSSLTYQWYRGTKPDTSNAVGGGTTASINVSPAATTSYWVRVSNGCGTADSDTVVVTVSTSCVAPAVTTQPQTTTITAGQKVTLSVGASGSPLTYQWYQGAVDDTSTPIGTNASTVLVGPLVNTSYWVKITTPCGDAKSNAGVITVRPTKRRAAGHR